MASEKLNMEFEMDKRHYQRKLNDDFKSNLENLCTLKDIKDEVTGV